MAITKKQLLAPVLTLVAGAAAYMLLHATAPKPEQREGNTRPISVYTATVQEQSLALEVVTQGEVRAATELDLVAQVGGRVTWVSPEFTEGGRVDLDEALLIIEDTDYRLALSEARAQVAGTEVGVQQALADADVARKQLRNDPGASDLALKKPQVAEAKARLQAAQSRLEQARVNVARTRITLPFDGRLLSTRTNIGQYVSPGSILGRAFATDRVEIRLPLSDSQLASLDLPIGFIAAQGEALPVAFSAVVAGREQQWHGHLLRLDAAVDPDSRMLYAMAEVNDPYGKGASVNGMPMAAGLFVEAVIPARKLERALVIPPAALRAGDRVHVVNDKGRLDSRMVTVLHRNSERVVIASGLQQGEQVIVSAIRNAIPGMALLAIPQPGAEVAAAPTAP
ncbi:efflux RND transporter periplasmic adaptor subunit [Kineobactrum sediminis]|uniref:efflux RND transporter periplasmic adaptor subunit n=1 Tax=Kineobactrum sediminis TaxID=1905677 RepID=UPI001F4D4CAA|nr:efflux RND transporter periplasmic adaptor subunit [Kineobactrum sediminis]